METPASLFESLLEKVESYGKTTIELTKLKLLDKITIVSTSLIARIFVIIIILLFVIFLSVGIALYLGELFGKSYYGFLIVAAFYLFIWVVCHFFLYKWIKKTISDSIIKQALE